MSPGEETYHNGDSLVNHGGGGIQAGRVLPDIQGGPRRQAETCLLQSLNFYVPQKGPFWREVCQAQMPR